MSDDEERLRFWGIRIGPFFHHHHHHHTAGVLVMATLQIDDTQGASFAIGGTDAAGQPTTVPAGAVTATSDNPAVATVVVPSVNDPAGSTGDVLSAGVGKCNVTVVDAETGGTNLTVTFEVDVTAGPATGLGVTFGTPFSKTPAAATGTTATATTGTAPAAGAAPATADSGAPAAAGGSAPVSTAV